jgi:hypothetical protein
VEAMNQELEVGRYVGPIRVSARHVQHVAGTMEAAMPSDADAAEKAAMAEGKADATAVQEALNDRDRLSAGRVRPALLLFGTAWVVVFEIMSALARLGSDVSARAAKAQAMLALLFPEGITFVKEDAGAAWAAGQRRLDRIESEGLGPAIVELVGSDVLEAAKRATAGLREASGAGPAPRDQGAVVADRVASFTRHLAIYCRLLLAKLDETDPASVERFRRAVLPLDEYRASRRGSETDEELLDAVATPGTPPIAPGLPGSPPFGPA